MMNYDILKIKYEEISELVNKLNTYRDNYYNKNISTISDFEYDKLYDKLESLEKQYNIILSNSPTQTVGYEVKSELVKVQHEVPLLSLNKTQDINEFYKFVSKSETLLMHKLDGLTVELIYDKGVLIQASTRGDGIIGEDITHNARQFINIPITIPIQDKVKFIGEAIITRDVFNKINETLSDDNKYKNPRNLASGSIRQLDSSICKNRQVKFICWNANDISDGYMSTGLQKAKAIGFEIVNYVQYTKCSAIGELQIDIEHLKSISVDNQIPIDGIVAIYNNIEYGQSLGKTAHHFNNGFAYKFYDEEVTTILNDIEWSIGKTGELTPVAIFNPVEIDGTIVSRASLHNVNTIRELQLGIGDTISVCKANQIIPYVCANITKSDNVIIPDICPICKHTTQIKSNITPSKVVEVLVCTNDNCKGKLLKRISHFVSKPCMNIIGLSESTIQKFIELNIVNSVLDIYNIKEHKKLLYNIEGFGMTSINNLISSIEKSKHTTVDRLLNSLSILSVGTSTAKILAKLCNNNPDEVMNIPKMELTSIEGFGEIIQNDIRTWFNDSDNTDTLKQLISILSFDNIQIPDNISNVLKGKSFVITGKLNSYANRDELISVIQQNGGKVQSSVSTSTSYLINNDNTSNSTKNKKAKELNIPIITETEFNKLINKDNTTITDTDKLSMSPIIADSLKPHKTTKLTKSHNKKKLF